MQSFCVVLAYQIELNWYVCIKFSALTFYAFLAHWGLKAFKFEDAARALDFKR